MSPARIPPTARITPTIQTTSTTRSKPAVCCTEVPADLATARRLRSLADREGIVIVDPLSHRAGCLTTTDLANAILLGMGKSQQITVLKRKPEPLAVAWLCSLHATARTLPDEAEAGGPEPLVVEPLVVVLEAQAIPAAETEELLGWFEVAGLDSVFVFTTTSTAPTTSTASEQPRYRPVLGSAGVLVQNWQEWAGALETRPVRDRFSPLADPAPSSPGWRVPRADGLLFRSACREKLTEAEFTAVDALFVDRVEWFLSEFAGVTDPSPVRGRSTVVRRAIEMAPSTEELIVVVRAAQVASLRSGYQMAVNTPQLIAAAEVLCRRGLDGPQDWWRRLGAYQDPDPGALAALWWLGLGVEASTCLRVGDIGAGDIGAGDKGIRITRTEHDDEDRDGPELDSSGLDIPVDHPAAQFLIAQRIYRLLCGAGPGDPLFSTFQGPGITRITAVRQMRQVTAELGIDLIEDKDVQRAVTAKTYLARYGITLTKLLKAANGTLGKPGTTAKPTDEPAELPTEDS